MLKINKLEQKTEKMNTKIRVCYHVDVDINMDLDELTQRKNALRSEGFIVDPITIPTPGYERDYQRITYWQWADANGSTKK